MVGFCARCVSGGVLVGGRGVAHGAVPWAAAACFVARAAGIRQGGRRGEERQSGGVILSANM